MKPTITPSEIQDQSAGDARLVLKRGQRVYAIPERWLAISDLSLACRRAWWPWGEFPENRYWRALQRQTANERIRITYQDVYGEPYAFTVIDAHIFIAPTPDAEYVVVPV